MTDATPPVPEHESAPPRFPSVPGHYPTQTPVPVAPEAVSLTDGQWRRMHPATPFLRGGLALVAIVGVLIANLRDRAVNLFVPDPGSSGRGGGEDEGFYRSLDEFGGVWLVGGLGILLVIALVVAFSYFSWRRNTYRVTDDAVEVRSGILNRQHRQAPLDRIQGVNINKPLFARLLGAAKLTVATAGQGSNVELSYLRAVDADELRRAILGLVAQHRRVAAGAVRPGGTLADTVHPPAAPVAPRPLVLGPDGQPLPGQIGPGSSPLGGLDDPLTRRVNEFFAPEPELLEVEPDSIVRIPPARLVASLIYNWGLVWVLVVVAGAIVVPLVVPEVHGWIWFILVPFVIAMTGAIVSQTLKLLRFSIAQTRDGVRIGYGLLSITNETIPPGRIHAVEVKQPALWRGLDWWTIRITRAGSATVDSNGTVAMNTLLPVGSRADVERVLAVLLPEHTIPAEVVEAGLTGTGDSGGYTGSPRRSWVYLLWGRRRNGVQITAHTALIRRGVLSRRLVAVPLARVQSVSLTQGWLARQLRVASLQPQVVLGSIVTLVTALDRDVALRLINEMSSAITAASAHDDRAG
ncbi:PH domain-containing protein [Klugiella xanthotipulae]|uniref:Putative membrane protein n=1 Tax=Klugiella xanthotipulae TaxID=244735 RepID=A0A543I5M7_9MICO|nr:PH domain-containing protein [Klugiella xanthotipulae]TQM65878.1 putative membrane protein [Klugiella xanthotipulae]